MWGRCLESHRTPLRLRHRYFEASSCKFRKNNRYWMRWSSSSWTMHNTVSLSWTRPDNIVRIWKNVGIKSRMISRGSNKHVMNCIRKSRRLSLSWRSLRRWYWVWSKKRWKRRKRFWSWMARYSRLTLREQNWLTKYTLLTKCIAVIGSNNLINSLKSSWASRRIPKEEINSSRRRVLKNSLISQ